MNADAIFVHGYGVRGFFWSALRNEMSADFGRITTPDLEIKGVDSVVEELVAEVRRARDGARERPVVLVGHSLGGVIAAMAAQRLGREEVSHLVVIASPYGDVAQGGVSRLLRLAIRFKLIPPALIRPRFFGPEVPEQTQKELFSKAVPESKALQDLTRRRRWFHTGAFTEPLEQAVLTIASQADRIVDPKETLEFARELRGETLLFPKEAGIGHNDFGYWPPAAEKTANEIRRFLERR